ncbi:glycine--tRNA ligase subunit beta [Niveispirillum cyanobacteriorum]|uniref:Glycine--tRNA ligase beta subunit n=1 Tax=Niveispirillum cyanobacteriorum TaxID=1612173 RepID=A0A2K9N6V4_9PROT|nr:glycine--tRNA ligase subunit beta [Niveispirillum cyanobacteriorum]AUN28837.1 glycine--tRNA ligase subunit beta [Niveispirillum cyanobacteriorum]GGE69936.1 glycine--tRNA ligase beta subunit [Niveispirillum cyanobacteriorum]
MAELLIELFMEEIPARMQVRAGEDFKRLVTDKLSAAGIGFTKAEVHSTPRRLALLVDGLPTAQADVREEKKGPRVGSPEQALAGFLKSAGLSSIDQAEQRDTGKGVFYFAVIEKKGGATIDALPGIIDAAIRELPWPKSMRWGANEFLWVRPLHSIIALFDGAVIPGALDLGGKSIAYGNQTEGHRFLSPGVLTVSSFADYAAKLAAAHVVLDREERKRLILAGAQKAAAAEGFVLKDDPGLLEEVAGLVEWPVVLTGAIDNQFMDVPAEVLTTSMRTHQRYFALETADGKLAPRFVVVANRTTIDGGKAVIAGNERVLRARLSDAKFFWDQDLKVKLEDRVPGLKDITFHAKLGTLAQRVERIQALSVAIAKALNWDEATIEQAALAARLSKSDLTTGVVGEFPEVQGIMGRYVAYHEGLPASVAEAIADHYKPLGPSDRVPTDKVSVAVALAEKIDTLVAFFGIDEKPTGSRDPFALRRAALGVIRLIVENGLRVKLGALLLAAGATDPVTADLLSFFNDRLKVSLKEKGVRHDLIDAVLALGGEDDFVRLLARVEALSGLIATDDGKNLLAASKRASNILRIEEKKDGPHDGAVDAGLLTQDEEKALADALVAAHKQAAPLIEAEDFTGAMAAFAALRAPVDAFFEKVTVNAPEAPVRANRLRLLSQIRATLNLIADFSKIEG